MSQWVHFDLVSEQVSAATITGIVGIEPDELMVRGSKRSQPPLPAVHSWSLTCRGAGLALDDQVELILDRVRPIQSALRDLVRSTDVEARLVFVRYFDDEDGEDGEDGEDEVFEASITPDGKQLERLPGQHQLLGWTLPTQSLALLASIDAWIWADEYG